MIKKLLFLSIILAVLGCSSKSGVGPGLIHFEDTFSQRLNFYSIPDTLDEPVFYVDLRYEDSVKSVRTSLKPEKDSIEFYPLYVSNDNGSLTLQVMERKGDWYRVYTDDIARVLHWVYLEGEVMESWREFLPSVYTVKTAVRSNRLRRNPADKAQEYDIDTEMLCLRVMHVGGNWLKVRNDPNYCNEGFVVQKEFEGFLRWKDGSDLLIYFSP